MQKVRLEASESNGLANIDYVKVSGLVVDPAECGSHSVVSGEIYRIINKNSGKALEVADASSAKGTNIQQGTYVGGTHQQWLVTNIKSNYHTLTAQHSGQLVDVTGKRTADGTNIIQWPANGGFNQQWAITHIDSIWFTITARHSAKCLDVANSSTAEGANVHQWTYNGTDNQLWQLVPASGPVKIEKPNVNSIPDEFSLGQNYPNPFNPATTIRYVLNKPAYITLNVYNFTGQKVKTLAQQYQNAGEFKIQWDSRNDLGEQVSSGIYFYRLKISNSSGSHSSQKKMVLLK
jgi:flagellar hook assembly protein FlgD